MSVPTIRIIAKSASSAADTPSGTRPVGELHQRAVRPLQRYLLRTLQDLDDLHRSRCRSISPALDQVSPQDTSEGGSGGPDAGRTTSTSDGDALTRYKQDIPFGTTSEQPRVRPRTERVSTSSLRLLTVSSTCLANQLTGLPAPRASPLRWRISPPNPRTNFSDGSRTPRRRSTPRGGVPILKLGSVPLQTVRRTARFRSVPRQQW